MRTRELDAWADRCISRIEAHEKYRAEIRASEINRADMILRPMTESEKRAKAGPVTLAYTEPSPAGSELFSLGAPNIAADTNRDYAVRNVLRIRRALETGTRIPHCSWRAMLTAMEAF